MPTLLPSRAKGAEALQNPTSVGEKQTIPARHGTATFVPKGHTIKIINTYGAQVVDLWAFALGQPPEEDEESGSEGVSREEESSKGEDIGKSMESEKTEAAKVGDDDEKESAERKENEGEENKKDEGTAEEEGQDSKRDERDEGSGVLVDKVQESTDDVKEISSEDLEGSENTEKQTEENGGNGPDQSTEAVGSDKAKEENTKPEKAPEKADEGMKKSWTAYIPSVRGRGKQATETADKQKEDRGKPAEKSKDKGTNKSSDAKEQTEATAESTADVVNDGTKSSSWSAYIPSIRGHRSKPKKEKTEEQKEKEKAGWSAYLPSGQGFSSYLPSKGQLSAFVASHERDPTKSYAEQLYDFSKTPVGAAGLSVATGSGYASSLYAAYSAYSSAEAARAANAPPMEYMSMQHTRASIKRLVPRAGDTLTTNLRAPILTLVEDTSPGAHDTLMAPCDPQRYKELGVDKWEEHGSCAENLVFALKEINQKAGLKGRKAIGSDVTVYTVPAALNLFMNVPWTDDGALEFAAPKGKRGDYVRFRADRDAVVVMSACPQDVLAINGKRPMVAHFVVESPSEDDMKKAAERDAEAQRIIEKAKARTAGQKAPRKLSAQPKPTPQRTSSTPKTQPAVAKPTAEKPAAAAPSAPASKAPAKKTSAQAGAAGATQAPRKPSTPAAGMAPKTSEPSAAVKNSPQPGKKKPKKLERRGTPQSGTPQKSA